VQGSGARAAEEGARQAAAAPPPTERELQQEDRIGELERQIEVVVEELARVRDQVALPEQPALESAHGLGPAASKVYGIERGLSIGGYAEANYRNFLGDKDRSDSTDFLRLVTYLGYKFTDSIVFNTEIEYEHAKTDPDSFTGGGEVSVEFAALDFLLRDWANIRVGLVLLPMGFLNEQHEPTFFHGVNRPEVERRIIPTTWRENGVGIFGTALGEALSYRAYFVNGFNARGYSPSGLRGGRQNGSRALAEDIAFVARADWNPIPELLLGGSFYTGDAGQDQTLTENVITGATIDQDIPAARTSIFEAHAQYRRGLFQARGLITAAFVDDADDLTAALLTTGDLESGAIAERMTGYYGELSYDVLAWLRPDSNKSLEPFVRVEYVNTQDDMPSGFGADRSQIETIYTAGASFSPHPNVVLKADYRNRDPRVGDSVDELNLGIGLVF
jgi:hypothetical protein